MKMKLQPVKHTLLALLTSALSVAIGQAATVYGGTTSVALNAATVSALTGLGFAITPVAPSTLGGTPLTASFAITGGNSTTMITHSGGLTFTEGLNSASIENFVINLSGPNANTVTGQVVVGNVVTSASTAFFDIGPNLALTLDGALAGDLTAVFGAPNLTGAPIGFATVAAVTTPEPASIAMVSLGMLAAGLLFRRKNS